MTAVWVIVGLTAWLSATFSPILVFLLVRRPARPTGSSRWLHLLFAPAVAGAWWLSAFLFELANGDQDRGPDERGLGILLLPSMVVFASRCRHLLCWPRNRRMEAPQIDRSQCPLTTHSCHFGASVRFRPIADTGGRSAFGHLRPSAAHLRTAGCGKGSVYLERLLVGPSGQTSLLFVPLDTHSIFENRHRRIPAQRIMDHSKI